MEAQKLSEKELFILKSFCFKVSRKDIATKMMITEKTLRHYLHNIYSKIDCTKLHEACVWYIRNIENKESHGC